MTNNNERIVLNDRYEIQNRIGRGGMADVFLARDVLLDRPVAIKVLFPEFATDPNFVERFRREAQSAANLNHPNIVSVYDWGKYSNTYFMAMEYVQGRTLADILRANGHVSSVQAAEIASEVSAALSFAHRNGVVHRDIKPANILIGTAGAVKVADFGIARAMNAPTESNLTQVGSVMGTATYFSPEQAQGAQPDPRSDLYSLGIVLYEMVAGKPPFTGENPVGIAYKQVHDAPQPLNQLVADVPRPFEAIVAKLLAKSPDMRYADADALRDDLRRFRAGEPVLALAGITPTAPPQANVATTTMPRTTAVPSQAAGAATYASAAQQARTTAIPQQRMPEAQPPVQYQAPNRNGLYAVMGFIAVIALVIGGVLLYNTLTKDDGDEVVEPTTVAVPQVVGLTYEAAVAALTEAGLTFEPVALANPADPATPENQVWQTDPAADTVVEIDTPVKVFFQPVLEPAPVPNVVGQNLEEAKRILSEAQFVPGEVTSETSDLPKDTVIRTVPAALELLKPGGTVAIVLSGGPDTQPIPEVTGFTQDAAKRLLEGAPFSFVVTIQTEASADVTSGSVIRTEPAFGGELAPGSPITLFVSSGVEQVQVPPVVGLTEAQAKNQITSKGLTANVTFVNVPSGDANDGRVISQSPTGGNLVAPGSAVGLQVGRAVAPPTTSTTTTTTTIPPTTTSSTTTTTTTIVGP
ncbi:MAG: Stk1 family PASTA domain-containing Ser/Thr kinase [Actinobacteria bacterium]|nr:Stk1 family PASTA domain-containing Ser/Thr kinase [Actinomycetota bacterium]